MPACQRALTVDPDPAAIGATGPFLLDPRALARLARFNQRWNARLALCRQHLGAPWWAPGLVLDEAVRARYETYLPITEFCHDLAGLARAVLPHPAWVPRGLRLSQAHTQPRLDLGSWTSLPEFWNRLPPRLAGRTGWPAADLPALLCALADPPRLGTDAERYPGQVRDLLTALAGRRGPGLRVLDLACGVGLDTCDVLRRLRVAGHTVATAVGVTLEPLEAWMASHACLPHDPRRQQRLRHLAAAAPPVHFLAADVRRLPLAGTWDLILCNGLAGGPACGLPQALRQLLAELQRLLAPAGQAWLANRFHEGYRRNVARFVELAVETGWKPAGDWHNLCLKPPVAAGTTPLAGLTPRAYGTQAR